MTKGITLIETILYIALFSVLIITALPLFVDFNNWRYKQTTFERSITDYELFRFKVIFFIKNSKRIIEPIEGEFSNKLVFEDTNNDRLTLKIENDLVLENSTTGESVPIIISTTTKVSDLGFYRPETLKLKNILFGIRINEIHFGTTTSFLNNE